MRRARWMQEIKEIEHHRLLFLDESGAKTNMTRRAGRGIRVRDSVPSGRWESTTMMAVVGRNGPQAPWVFPDSIDGDVFTVYAERVLAPTLLPGDILVMDNLSTHKNKRAREAIEATGAIIWGLPPYSPDLNPIEKMWSKAKAHLRKEKARTYDDLVQAIGGALASVSQEDIRGWFGSCGYSFY